MIKQSDEKTDPYTIMVQPSRIAYKQAETYSAIASDSHKKDYGQYFTPLTIGEYLASLISVQSQVIRILDPGFGTGVLSCALIESLVSKNALIKHIELDAYDVDKEIVPFVEPVLVALKASLAKKNISCNVNFVNDDFVLTNRHVWDPLFSVSPVYDIVISNPPYFKMGKDDPRNMLARSRQLDQPNIYSLFIVLATLLTKPRGELVFIIPRSFTSGPYFDRFRSFLYDHLRLDVFHMFHSRSKAFKKDAVLQENIVFKATRVDNARSEDYNIAILSSESGSDFSQSSRIDCTLDDIVDLDSREKVLFLPTNEKEQALVTDFKNWRFRLNDFGIEVSTGPVVAFRAVQYLEESDSELSVSLLWIDNVRRWEIIHPNKKNRPQYILLSGGTKAGLIPKRNYVLLRRFSAKDDKHRLIAAPFYASQWSGTHIGLENKLNYLYSRNGELTDIQVAGITSLLNSDLYDAFFRIFNGNTQVSATEARALPMPSLDLIEEMGRRVLEEVGGDIERIVNETLNRNFTNLKMESEHLDPKAVEAQIILEALGLPKKQQNKISAYTLLALCGIGESDAWNSATNGHKKVSRGIRDFIEEAYGVVYKENTRETFRRQVLHQFIQGGVVKYNPGDPTLAVNSPNAHYGLTKEALEVIQAYGSADWTEKAKRFADQAEVVRQHYSKDREMHRVPLTLPDGSTLLLSPGLHNDVQRAVVEEFASRFAIGSELLYLGDTESKYVVLKEEKLKLLNIPLGKTSKLPDILLYNAEKNWLYLIEVATAHGPISIKRKTELIQLLEKSDVGPVFVTVYEDLAGFKKDAKDIAWETEVWVMEIPDHMIHYNGDRFLGPH